MKIMTKDTIFLQNSVANTIFEEECQLFEQIARFGFLLY